MITYRLNLYPFHIVYWSLKLFLTIFLKKRNYDISFPLNIDHIQIESISISYCVLESKALFNYFSTKRPYDISFPLNIDYIQIESISISYCVLESKAFFNYISKQKDLKIFVFPWILITYRLNLYPFLIVYWSLKLLLTIFLQKDLMIFLFPWILNMLINLIIICLCSW